MLIDTQTTDIEDECDGWLTFDRVEKFSPKQYTMIMAAQSALFHVARNASVRDSISGH